MAINKDKSPKQLYAYQSESLRSFVEFINNSCISKEDIVSIFQDNRTEEFVILYYK